MLILIWWVGSMTKIFWSTQRQVTRMQINWEHDLGMQELWTSVMIMNSSPYFVKKTVMILPFQINRQFENSEQEEGFIVWKIFLHSNFFLFWFVADFVMVSSNTDLHWPRTEPGGNSNWQHNEKSQKLNYWLELMAAAGPSPSML